MNKATRLLIIFIYLIISFAGYAQNVVPPYEVGTWQGFRTAAISYTFDDGSPNQFTKAVPMFNEFGFKLTLFTVTSASWGWPANWTVLQAAASQGHEIASHTVNHGYLNSIKDSLQTIELKNSQDAINAHITGQRCVTIAYPYCVTGDTTLCAQYYIAARICSGIIEPTTPADFMNISSIICGPEGPVKTAKNFNDRANSAASSKGWCVYLIHGVDNDGGWSSLSSDTLRASLEYLMANQDKFWVSSFGNVARYIKERNTASVAEVSSQDSSITLQVTDTLPDSIFNYPVTLRRPLPEGWPSAAVSQNGHSRDARIVTINAIPYIQFDVVPDSGDVLISKSNTTRIQYHGNVIVPAPVLSQNYPNPFNSTTTIKFNLATGGFIRLDIYDLAGREIKRLLAEKMPAGDHTVHFMADGLSSGIYLYQIKSENFVKIKKMILIK
jgi:peptidoglycan/xylan/chitin deacetylase (PgdA/CDA1 family)